MIKDWLILVKQSSHLGEAKLFFQNILERFFVLTTKQSLDEWLDYFSHKVKNQNYPLKKTDIATSSIICIYCNVSFSDKTELGAHCLTQEHETMIMSDEGHDWQWRAPPRGFKSDCYVICENWRETGSCRFGAQCVEAHGEPELLEWRERFQYREMKLLRAKEKELYGK